MTRRPGVRGSNSLNAAICPGRRSSAAFVRASFTICKRLLQLRPGEHLVRVLLRIVHVRAQRLERVDRSAGSSTSGDRRANVGTSTLCSRFAR